MNGFGYIIVLLVLAVSSIHQSVSLQCYACLNEPSIEACTKSQTVITCPSGKLLYCLVATETSAMGGKKYHKGCEKPKACADSVEHYQGTTFARKCCTTNLCNTFSSTNPGNSARSTMLALQGMLTIFAAVSIMLFFAY
eukprot:Seg1115.2 transcript_id=Seg1115.2/GoldUCD/mRNA.D3Y31 product="hypothetical protein" pseudo=true protein_id=Seg1115.2/GoldUCD/D3Y31